MFFQATEPWLVHSPLTLYPTGRSWQSCVHPLTLRFKHSFTLQFLSSERSPQSSLPSHRFLSEMQRPLEHMKKEPLHKLPERSKTRPVTDTTPCNFSTKSGTAFDLTMDLDRLIPFKEALLVVAPFVSAICPRRFFLGKRRCFWHWWRDSSCEPHSSLTCSQTFEVQRQFVRVVGTVCKAITFPLRAEKTAAVPAAKFLWSTGAID